MVEGWIVSVVTIEGLKPQWGISAGEWMIPIDFNRLSRFSSPESRELCFDIVALAHSALLCLVPFVSIVQHDYYRCRFLCLKLLKSLKKLTSEQDLVSERCKLGVVISITWANT